MKSHPIIAASALALVLAIAACSSGTQDPDADASPDVTATGADLPAPAASPSTQPADPASDRVLTLEGLGDLKIGRPVPSGGAWAARGAQASDACQTVSSPRYPGVYAIVTGSTVRRITVGQRSDVKLIEGIGVGATESAVKQWFAGFREEPHKYVEAPAKYLTSPNAPGGTSALRFELGSDRKVSLIHVGTTPELEYVEGCS